MLFTVRQGSFFYSFYLFNAILIKVAVPLFFMVSGALLLGKEESYAQLVKRFFKFSIVLLFASIVSYLYRHFRLENVDFTIKEFIALIYVQPVAVALWYLYAYLAYILMLPFLRCLAQHLDQKGFQWLFLMYGLYSLIPLFEFITFRGKYDHYSAFKFFICTNYLIYPMLGYYIEHKLKSSVFSKKRLLILVSSSIISICVCAALTHWKCTLTGNWDEGSVQDFFNSLIFIPAGTIYYGIKIFFAKYQPHERTCKLITALGSATFGLYLIENICREETVFIFSTLDQHIPTILACWIWIFFACAVGIIITMLLKKFKFISKYI